MFLKPESRALRALLWFAVVVVPGGFVLLALLAADALQRRARQQIAASRAELTDVSLSGLATKL
jgi:hypothetical protein